MKRIWAITQIAIKENLRNRFIYFIFIAAIVFILMGRGCSMEYTTTTTGPSKILQNSISKIAHHAVFHLIAAWSVLLCSLLSMNAITKELEEKTLVMVLARPLSRSSLLMGKLLSVIIISVVTLYLLAGIFFGLYYIKTGVANANIFLGYSGVVFSLTLTAIFSFFCSLILPRLAVPIVALFVYITSLGAELPFFYDYIGKVLKPSSTTMILNKILPQFGEIQFTGATIMISKATLGQCFLPAINLLLYAIIFWGILIFIFKKMEI